MLGGSVIPGATDVKMHRHPIVVVRGSHLVSAAGPDRAHRTADDARHDHHNCHVHVQSLYTGLDPGNDSGNYGSGTVDDARDCQRDVYLY